MPKTIAYARTSSVDQNLYRQRDEMLKLGIEEKYIYEDKQSGKDFERIGYQYMKKSIEPGDTLVIKSLDRLGRNQKAVRKEWQWYMDNRINIRVLDMPVLNRDYKEKNAVDQSINELIRNLVFEIISWTDEEHRRRIKESQREGIDAAKKRNVHLGRPRIELSSLTEEQIEILDKNYGIWKKGEIKGVSFAEKLGLKKNSFYKILKEYEKNGITKNL